MKPVMQTRVGILGNCLSACVASLLDYESIPNWLDISAGIDSEWFIKLNNKLGYLRYKYYQYYVREPINIHTPTIECIMHFESKIVRAQSSFTVESTSGVDLCRQKHAVIYDRVARKVIHDPHPQGIVINSLDEWEPKYIGFLLPR